MLDIQSLKTSNEEFVRKIKKYDAEFFARLSEGQSPSLFVLSCCDARTSPSTITGMPLGELFTHRNIANQVTEEDDSFRASLYYALDVLKVQYVVVIGHTHCGGIAAAHSDVRHEALDGWLKNVKQTLETCDKQQGESGLRELEVHNVREQVKNVKNHSVYKKYGNDIPVIGMLFDLESGELKTVESDE